LHQSSEVKEDWQLCLATVKLGSLIALDDYHVPCWWHYSVTKAALVDS
jgi:hypothetical protein